MFVLVPVEYVKTVLVASETEPYMVNDLPRLLVKGSVIRSVVDVQTLVDFIQRFTVVSSTMTQGLF
jgi:hypothetical protein